MDFTNYGLTNSTPPTGKNFHNRDFIPARVVDVILDSSHPEWVKYNQYNAVGAIKYAVLGTEQDIENPETLSVAFPLNNNIRQLPLKNEVVLLVSSPSYIGSKIEYATLTYYETIVGLWNTPNHNALPTRLTEEVDLGKDIDELSTINPMQPFPGDIILEGRQGQSIRFTGYPHPLNPFTDDENKTLPLIIISNGQIETLSGLDHIVEDVNEDYSSIYLTSNHSIPLNPARTKRSSFKTEPVESISYKGNQVIVNGGRLYFNAKEEDIHLNALGNVGITSKVVGIDGEDYIGLDAKKIYLGVQAKKFEQQPVILGDQLEIFLNTLVTSIARLGGVLTSATTVSGQAIPSLNLEGFALQSSAQGLLSQLNPTGPSQLKSKKVFTE